MPAAALTIAPPDALAKLGAGLAAYQRVSGKDASAVLLQKGAQVLYGNSNPKYGATFPGLVSLFRRETPGNGAIYSAARSRGFRLGRKAYGGALSPQAIDRASRMMGGESSILAVSSSAPGEDFPILSFVRRGMNGRRVRYRSGRMSYAGSAKNAKLRRAGDKVLNFRAVASYFEVMLRNQGRKFLAAGFLFQRWRKLAQSDPRRDGGDFRVLVNQNPRSRLGVLGTAALSGDAETGNVQLRITSNVPGTLVVGQARGLFARVIGAVNDDIATYLARKQRESAIAELRARGVAA